MSDNRTDLGFSRLSGSTTRNSSGPLLASKHVVSADAQLASVRSMCLALMRDQGALILPRARSGEVGDRDAVPGKDSEAVINARIKHVGKLPQELYKSPTWAWRTERARRKRVTVATDVQVYFCDSQHPWRRRSNENTKGLLRQYFPNGTDLFFYRNFPDVIEHMRERRKSELPLKRWRTELKLARPPAGGETRTAVFGSSVQHCERLRFSWSYSPFWPPHYAFIISCAKNSNLKGVREKQSIC
jgi:hypothetical protein